MSIKRPSGEGIKRTVGSGEHPAVTQLHEKIAEANNVTIPAAERAADKAEAVLANEQAPPVVSPTPELSGEWTILIRGRGPHHNFKSNDANRISARAVKTLLEAGQTIVHASFTNGSEESLHDASALSTEPNTERNP